MESTDGGFLYYSKEGTPGGIALGFGWDGILDDDRGIAHD